MFAEQTFLINVGDINDHSPMFGDFDSGNSYNATIREDATTGTILRNISVTDRDAGRIVKCSMVMHICVYLCCSNVL